MRAGFTWLELKIWLRGKLSGGQWRITCVRNSAVRLSKWHWAAEGPFLGLIHHSDRGSQYAGGKYRKLINKGGLTQSMSRKGECLDNAPMESFFASLKKELVHRQRFRTRAQAKAAIFEYIEVFYNRQRRHSSIGYQTPVQAFEDMTWKMAA